MKDKFLAPNLIVYIRKDITTNFSFDLNIGDFNNLKE